MVRVMVRAKKYPRYPENQFVMFHKLPQTKAGSLLAYGSIPEGCSL
jgi:hypothetical protein